MAELNVISIEFDGIDKCGKDTVIKQIASVMPNKYIINSRGLLSQIAYAKMFNRNWEYKYTKGYLDNTLFVYLTVDEDDWNVRCDITNEKALNKTRVDIEREVKYQESVECFEYALNHIRNFGINENQILILNSSKLTPYQMIKRVQERIEELNK